MHLAAFSDSHTNRLSLNTRSKHHTEDSQSLEPTASNETLFKSTVRMRGSRKREKPSENSSRLPPPWKLQTIMRGAPNPLQAESLSPDRMYFHFALTMRRSVNLSTGHSR